jgi:hypothetical protein
MFHPSKQIDGGDMLADMAAALEPHGAQHGVLAGA